jgi:hypothetical protein
MMALAALVTAVLALALASPQAIAQDVGTFASGLPDVWAMTRDGAGTMYIARRTPSNVIVKCTPPSNTMSLFTSGLSDPTSIVCDAAGNVYVANYNYAVAGGSVVKVTPGGVKSTFAALPNPISLAIDGDGNLYVGRNDRIINKITPGGVVSTYADLNTVSYLGVASANNHVYALALGPDGTLYAGVSWGAIFRIGPGGSPIEGFNRSMLQCEGLVMGPDGYLYGSSYTYDEVWKISTAGIGTLYAGKTNTPGFVNGPLLTARFNNPAGLFIDRTTLPLPTLYVADYGNSAVRATNIDGTSPAQASSWGRMKAMYR